MKERIITPGSSIRITADKGTVLVNTYFLNGYRPVTQGEREKYNMPSCAMYWDAQCTTFREVDGGSNWDDSPYFVPVEYEFKERNPLEEVRDILTRADYTDGSSNSVAICKALDIVLHLIEEK